jgi:hypothetical protein
MLSSMNDAIFVYLYMYPPFQGLASGEASLLYYLLPFKPLRSLPLSI